MVDASGGMGMKDRSFPKLGMPDGSLVLGLAFITCKEVSCDMWEGTRYSNSGQSLWCCGDGVGEGDIK